MRKLIFILINLFLLAGCLSPVKPVEIKAGKQGGLFEISETGRLFPFYDSKELLRLDTSTYIPLSTFERVQQENSDFEGLLVLNLKLNKEGAAKFKAMSERNINKQICFVVENKIISAPTLQSTVTNGYLTLQAHQNTIRAVIQYLEK